MKNYLNIEKSGFSPRRQYVGYDSTGRSWQIFGKHGNWNAIASHTVQGKINALFMCNNLQEISDHLKEI